MNELAPALTGQVPHPAMHETAELVALLHAGYTRASLIVRVTHLSCPTSSSLGPRCWA
jgi:hypothetical protein